MRNLTAILTVGVMLFCCVLSTSAQVVTETAKVPSPSENLVSGLTGRDDRYRIGFQDVIEIQVYRHVDLHQKVQVSPNGTIVLFRLDRPIVAVCKTERELADEIAAAYKAKYIRNPEVTVVVADQKSQSVMVIGAVEHPGNFYVNRKVHLLEMLAQAGGPNKESGTRVIVARAGSNSNCKEGLDENADVSVVAFKIRDVQEGKQTFWLQPGDVVSVFEADIVYVYGNVNQQGAIKVREPITLTQAIVSAEGLKSAAKKEKIRILRQKAGSGDREEMVFDLNQIDKGKIKDPFLEPNDIVAVSEDKTKAIILGFAKAIKNSAPNAIYRLPK